MTSGAERPVYMIIDRETREAYREGDDPKTAAPLFFTSHERLHAYAREEEIEDYEIYELPGSILARMKGKPHWVDGSPG